MWGRTELRCTVRTVVRNNVTKAKRYYLVGIYLMPKANENSMGVWITFDHVENGEPLRDDTVGISKLHAIFSFKNKLTQT